jgi:4-diphosphocytidyl-2-C-methyl-D-erythritol kinase
VPCARAASSLLAVVVKEHAYAKLNLVLQVGRPRSDGMHPLCSLFASIELADELEGGPAEEGADSIECAGVEGDNLALGAIVAFRRRTGGLPDGPVRVRIEKQIPVAAGLGGGSADAAAALRLVNRMSGLPLDATALRDLAAELGADVPSQIEPRHALVQGVGEQVEPLALPPLVAVLVPSAEGLRTADVYTELDRLGGGRARLDSEALRELAAAAPDRLGAALENDLEPAALSLRPDLAGTLARLRGAGALGAAVSGSGPTCFGLFAGRAEADAAAAAIPGAIVSALRPG